MTVIYTMLGIVGWIASPVVIAAYIWKGVRSRRRSPPDSFARSSDVEG